MSCITHELRELKQRFEALEHRLSEGSAAGSRGEVVEEQNPAKTEEELQVLEEQLKDKDHQRKLVSNCSVELCSLLLLGSVKDVSSKLSLFCRRNI